MATEGGGHEPERLHFIRQGLRFLRQLLPRQGHKNDFRDAHAVAEAVQRPTTRFVLVKTDEQLDLQALHRVRVRIPPRNASHMKVAQKPRGNARFAETSPDALPAGVFQQRNRRCWHFCEAAPARRARRTFSKVARPEHHASILLILKRLGLSIIWPQDPDSRAACRVASQRAQPDSARRSAGPAERASYPSVNSRRDLIGLGFISAEAQQYRAAAPARTRLSPASRYVYMGSEVRR